MKNFIVNTCQSQAIRKIEKVHVIEGLRKSLKAATSRNFWLRYASLAPWRLAYAAYTFVSKRNISGLRGNTSDETRWFAKNAVLLYKRWSGIPHFYGRLAEVGPGNTLETADLFLADGCEHVDQVDRFNYRSNAKSQAGIEHHNEPAERFFSRRRAVYDFIVSNAVMEHLYDPIQALEAMATALKPGGTMIHCVDCSHHGQFSDSMHDLSFLRIPRFLYKPLTLASGLNRIRVSAYLSTLDALGLEYRVLITQLSGIPEEIVPACEFENLNPSLIEQSRRHVEAIKPKMADTFRIMSVRDLMISHFVLIARLPWNNNSFK